MPETVFDPRAVPTDQAQAASLLHRAWHHCRDAATAAGESGPFCWYDWQEAKLTLAVLAYATENPKHRPATAKFRRYWPFPLSDNQTNPAQPEKES